MYLYRIDVLMQFDIECGPPVEVQIQREVYEEHPANAAREVLRALNSDEEYRGFRVHRIGAYRKQSS